MFYNCSSLLKLDFSTCNNLNEIWWYAFYGCSSLETIDISGATITNINNNTNLNTIFNGCTNLKNVYVKDNDSKLLVDTALQESGLSITSSIKNNSF